MPEVPESISPSKGTTGNKWYNPIGITIKDGDNAKELKEVVEKVKELLRQSDEYKDYNLDSPSDLAKALLAFVITQEE